MPKFGKSKGFAAMFASKSPFKIETNLPEEEGSRISDKRKIILDTVGDEQPDSLYEGGDISKEEWNKMSDEEREAYIRENKEDI